MDFLKKIGVMAAGLGISGAIGAISGVLLLYVLIDAAIAGADEIVWIYLSGAVGVIVGEFASESFFGQVKERKFCNNSRLKFCESFITRVH